MLRKILKDIQERNLVFFHEGEEKICYVDESRNYLVAFLKTRDRLAARRAYLRQCIAKLVYPDYFAESLNYFAESDRFGWVQEFVEPSPRHLTYLDYFRLGIKMPHHEEAIAHKLEYAGWISGIADVLAFERGIVISTHPANFDRHEERIIYYEVEDLYLKHLQDFLKRNQVRIMPERLDVLARLVAEYRKII